MALSNQMEMFEDGGLKDEGGMTDEVSGNDVPSGSTREEVRDDIPAQLSEGEFVFPADVVRFLGLEKLMQMRQKAKMGLQKMESMGQMGNSDEATMPDDMPFDLNDLDMQEDVDNEEDVEYNKGGVVKAAVGAYVPPALPTSNPYDPTKNVYTGQTNEAVTPYMPKATNILGASDPSKLVGGVPVAEADSDMFEQRRYVNEATGQVRFVSFNKATGQSTTNVKQLLDQGFIRKDEAIKEAAKTSTPTASTQPSRPEESDNSYQDQMKEEEEYGIGAGRVNLGGTVAKETIMVGTGVKSRQQKGSLINSTTFGIQYADAKKGSGLVDFAKGAGKVGSVIGGGALAALTIGKGAFDAYQYSKGNMPADKVAVYTINGIPTVVRASVHNAIAKNPRGPEAEALIADAKAKKSMLDSIRKANPELSRKDAIKLTNKNFELAEAKKGTMKTSKGTEKTIDFIDRMEKQRQQELFETGETGLYSFDSAEAAANRAAVQANQEMAETNFGKGSGFDQSSDPYAGTGGDSSPGDNVGTGDNEGFSEGDSSDAYSDGYNKGGLAGKKKTPKTKKMKRGGLASR